MDKKVVIYETAMCCSSGVCGPNPDHALMDLQAALEEIKKMGAKIERYTITQSPNKFRENPQVVKLIQLQQLKALPITTCNGNVVKSGSYPTLEELKSLLQDGVAYSDKPVEALAADQGCCAGQDSCDIRCSPSYKGSIRGDSGYKCC